MTSIKNKIYIKLLIILIINMFIISMSSTIQAKYTFQYQFNIANLNIDRTKPKIELLSMENSNTTSKGHANKSDVIIIKIKVTDKNLKDVFLNKDYLSVKINDENVDDVSIKIDRIEDITDGGIYQIELTNLDGNGVLKVDILEGTVVDTGELKSELFEINTDILVDNIVNTDDNNINSDFIMFTYE